VNGSVLAVVRDVGDGTMEVQHEGLIWTVKKHNTEAAVQVDGPLELKAALRQAIEQGVPLWNVGDRAGCATVYLKVAAAFADVNPTLKSAVERARSLPLDGDGEDGQGWVLRRAIDRVLAEGVREEVGDRQCREGKPVAGAIQSPKASSDIELGGQSSPKLVRGLGPCGSARALWERLNALDVHNVKLFAWEHKQLASERTVPMAFSSMQVICWRRTVLQWSCCFYCIKLLMETQMFYNTVGLLADSYSEQVVFGAQLGDYAQYFQGFVWIEGAWALSMVFVGVVALIYSIKATCQWRSFYASVKVLSIAWVAVCGTPWLWAILEPIAFNLSLNVRGVQQQACADIILGNVERLSSVLDLVDPAIGNAMENVFSEFETPWAELGRGICDKPAQEVLNALSDHTDGLALGQGQVENVKYVLRLVFAERTWEIFFGLYYISKSRLLTLFPTVFGLMFGVIKGVRVARTIVPYSRIPGLLLLCAIGFTSPFLIVLFVSVNAILGNIWMLIGLLFFMAALISVNIPWEIFGIKFTDNWTLMTPASHESVARGIASQGKVRKALYVLAGIFIVFGLLLSDIVRTKLEWQSESLVELLQDQAFWYEIFFVLKVFVSDYFITAWTIRSLTQVVFTDWVLCLVLLIDGDEATTAKCVMSCGRSNDGSSTDESSIANSNEAALNSQYDANEFQVQKRKLLRELNDAF
jgi:hypothetical protein